MSNMKPDAKANISMVFNEKNIKTSKFENQPATFEEAITATTFGKFNIILFLIVIPTVFATMFETTAIAYVVPVAQCDLNLNLEDKGYLISATYLGMVLSAMVWGFLSDTLGRRRVIILGLFLNGIFVTMGGLAQSFGVLIFAKFMGGFIINGPYAIATTIISEYHCARHRAKAILCIGMIFCAANIVLPLMSLGIFSAPIDFNILGLKIHSWNILILITALPSYISFIGFYIFIPETPKFLMTSGCNEEALRVFKKVYAWNTGNHPDTFPIKALVDENKLSEHVVSSDKLEAFKNGFAQMKPLFMKPHLSKIVFVCTLKLGTLMGLNSLRLWLPQLFAFINDYMYKHNVDADICVILEENIYKNSSLANTLEESRMSLRIDEEAAIDCTVNYSNSFVYYNLMVISVGTIAGYLFVGTLINLLGKKVLYVTLGVISGVSAMSLYFAPNSYAVTALSTSCLALSGINSNVLMSIIIDLFPTTLRTTAVALALMIARLGSMVGNLIFPYLINAGCWQPFLYVGSTTFMCALMAIMLPRTDMKALQ